MLGTPKVDQLSQLFQQLVTTAQASARKQAPVAPVTELFPDGATDLPAAAAWVLDKLPADTVRRFDEAFQQEVLAPRGGLWGLLQGRQTVSPGNPQSHAWSAAHWLDSLKRKLQDRARAAVSAVLQDIDAAQLLLKSPAEADQATDTLRTHEQAALPALGAAPAWLHLVALLPKSPAGAELGERLTHVVPDVPATVLQSETDVVLCYEAAEIPLFQAALALVGSDTAEYASLAERVWTRTDVAWSPLSAVESAAGVAAG
jgi:hypothetical protein